MRYLWNPLDGAYHAHLPSRFNKIEPHRRLFYCNLVVSGWVGLFPNSRKAKNVLDGCVFHNLHTLHVHLVGGAGLPTAMYLPKMDAPRLDVVEVHIPAHHKVYFKTQGKVLKTRFPGVLQVGLPVFNHLFQEISHVLT